MRRISVILLFTAAILFPSFVSAGEKEGIMAEYRRVEEAYRNRTRSADFRLQTLKDNLMRAMRLALARRFYEKKDEVLARLTWDKIEYENPTSATVYYVKFETYILRLEYVRDPEFFVQSPRHEKFLIIDPEVMSHTQEQPTGQQPAPASNTPAPASNPAPANNNPR